MDTKKDYINQATIVVQNLPRTVDSHSADQEILCFYRIQRFIVMFEGSTLLKPILNLLTLRLLMSYIYIWST